MVKVRGSVKTHKRHKSVLKQAKGQFGQRSRRFRQALKSVVKGLTYQYRDRKVKKREFKRLWIIRINAACQQQDLTYSRFMNGLKKANVEIDRKMLSEMAINSPESFQKLVDLAKQSLN